MTNFEELTQIKTKKEAAKILFAFMTDYNFEDGCINAVEWLDKEYNPEETAKRIFQILFVGLETNNCDIKKDLYKTAIKNLEKQIPKKPKCSGSDEQDTACCPVCGLDFGTLENITYYNIYPSYCENCGQALDWSEEDV